MSRPSRARTCALVLCVVAAGTTVRPQEPVALPAITLADGEMYFRVDGASTVLLGTNPTGWDQGATSPTRYGHFEELFDYSVGDERVVRLHLTNGKVPNWTAAGVVDTAWRDFWDQVFVLARDRGLWVIPVFDVQADWREDRTGTQSWPNNIYNKNGTKCGLAGVTCGPAEHPLELLQDPTVQAIWLEWVRQLVDYYDERHTNILAWEVFSEIDLIANKLTDGTVVKASEADGVAFAEAAALTVRTADTQDRPVTASLSGIIDWPLLSTSSIEFVQLHPYANIYPYHGDLDDMIIASVRAMRAYGKPVVIGESGLSAATPLVCTHDNANDALDTWTTTVEMSSRAFTALNHAIWAGVVSGAAAARMLWFEDGYDKYHFNPPCLPNPETERLNLRSTYHDASLPVVQFLQGVDYTGFEPIDAPDATLTGGITGALLGNDTFIIGWVKDRLSAAPPAAPDPAAWPATPGWPDTLAPLDTESVTVIPAGRSHDWLVRFYDTMTGDVVQTEYVNQAADGSLVVDLPSFTPSLAFQIEAVPPIAVEIDVRPLVTHNRINLRQPRPPWFPVAVLTTATSAGESLDFDAASVDAATVRFGPAAAPPLASGLVDVDTDGDLDLVVTFDKSAVGFVCGDDTGVLTGEAVIDGVRRAIEGSDSVRIVGGCGASP